MLLKRYPEKKSVLQSRNEQIANMTQLKKSRNNMIRSIILSVVIIAVSLLIPNIILMIVCMMVSVYPASIALYSYRFVALSCKRDLFTEIHDDRIIHVQYDLFIRKKYVYTILFNNIKDFKQDMMGNLILYLKTDKLSALAVSKNGQNEIVLYKSSVSLFFVDSEPKYQILRLLDRRFKR